ncbi:hypothetical protein [Aureibacter tunicatorum]|uniref:Ankyrin repeat protein n=1 Tax=Aureibacter tunicatorum TaxID=866807 RepID=A0AAE3XMR0_9BACT|nr:hypothetical protein [Aureibacter tunicatorum]MDR6238755.1 hypothetical protein [Aureibacter tunicatorum]BDD05314.1 hypothetical protein AUTU_27970 [Aureibacter tunicatorum]
MSEKVPLTYYEVKSLLEQLGNGLDKEPLDLEGVDFNLIKEKGANILSKLAFEGALNALEYVLGKGADPNLYSSVYDYYKGPALLFALQNNISKVGVKKKIVETLISYKADVKSVVEWLDDETDSTASGSLIDYGMTLVRENIEVYEDEDYDAQSRKSSKEELIGLQSMLSVLKDYGADINDDMKEEYLSFMKREFDSAKKHDPKELLRKGIKILDVDERVIQLPEAAKSVCFGIMENESFMPSAEWADLFERLVKCSLTFEEVSEEVYGEVVAFVDDEGDLCQGWDYYNWFSELVELLMHEEAIKNPKWMSLLSLVVDEEAKYNSEIDFEFEELIALPHVQNHKSYEQIKKIVKEYIG